MLENFTKIYAPVLTGKENLNAKEISVLCPFHRDKNPSMSINTENGLYYCFACGAKGSAIGFYMKQNHLSYNEALQALHNNYSTPAIMKQIQPITPQKTLSDYTSYIQKITDASIFHDDHFSFYGKKLFDLRGITLSTAIACLVGYDPEKGWIFPVIKYPDEKIVGYEVRKKDFTKFSNGSKCFKADNTPSCLSLVYKGWKNEKAIICEGFIDACFMYQYKFEKNKGEQVNEWIFSPSNGVHSLPKLMKELKLWEKFDEIIFCLDNDKAGNDTKQELINLPHEDKFKFFNGLKDGEDIEIWYKRQ